MDNNCIIIFQSEFRVGEELISNKWNELWLDLRNVIHYTDGHADPGINREVRQFHIKTNGPPVNGGLDVKFLWDHIFPTDEPYTVNYFHNDYLGLAQIPTTDFGQNVMMGVMFYLRTATPFK